MNVKDSWSVDAEAVNFSFRLSRRDMNVREGFPKGMIFGLDFEKKLGVA